MVKITRLEAARRQLTVGLSLWFQGGDDVLIHTLICAAHQVLHDLNRKAGGNSMLFDSEYWRPDKKKEVVTALKESQNFFKHADLRKGKATDAIDFDPDSTEFFALFAIELLAARAEPLGSIERAFRIWQFIHRTDTLTGAAQKRVAEFVPVETMEAISRLERPQFLQRLVDLGVL